MIQEQSKASYKKLIKAINGHDQAEAKKLILQMDITELSKVDDEGKTALNHAITSFSDKICKLLLSKMSSKAINHVNGNGDTALTHAASNISTKICKLLIPKMSSEAISQANKQGETALILALTYHLDGVCEMLIPKMFSEAFNHVNNIHNYTALMLAIDQGYEEIGKLLIPKMSIEAINHVTEADETALSLAETKKFKTICSLLKARQEEHMDTNIVGQIAVAIITKLESDKTISVHNKSLFKEAINKITSKISHLTNTSDIVKITAGIKEFETGKITRGKLIDLNDEVNEIINGHPIDYYTTILGEDSAVG